MSRRITAALAAAAVTLILASGGASGRSNAPGQQLPQNQTLPSISGTLVVPNTLTAGTGTWKGKGLKFAYQWLRCDSAGASCSAITGATGSAKTLSTADAGSTLRVIVTASNRNGSAAATSAQTAVVAQAASPPSASAPPPTNLPPSDNSRPAVSGTTQQNQTLSTSTGSWSGTTPMTYTYQWQRCDSGGGSCAPISGATAASYVLAAPDVGSTLRASVTASNSAGSASASSDPTPVVTLAPTTAPTTGTVLKRINYEYPNATGVDPSIAGWQCQNVNEPGRGTLTKDSTTANSLTSSGLIVNPVTPSNATYGRSACEMLTGHTAKTGDNIYYSMAVRFPSGWSGHDDWSHRTTNAFFAYDNVGASGPITVDSYTNRVVLSLAAGNCLLGVGCDYDNSCGHECTGHSNNVVCIPSCQIVPSGQLTLSVWHQIIVHVYETPRADGLVEAWWRPKGEANWNKTVTMSGMPTMALGTNSFGHVFTAATYDAGTSDISDKFGIQDVDFSKSVSINQDDDCVSTSFDAAVSCFG
jgi:Polysaccharide lyase